MKSFFTYLWNNIKLLALKVFKYPYTITLAVIVFFMILFFITAETKIFFGRAADTLVKTIGNSDHLRDSLLATKANTNDCTKALYNQYEYMNRYKQQHLSMASTYERYYFSFTLILLIASVIASIMGVLIARTGWQNQTPSIKAAFIGFFFSASLTGLMTNVFNNADNVNKNISKYFYFTNLQTNIYDVMATGVDSNLNKRCADSTLLRVFWDNNKSMKENMNLFLDIKADKIPATDFSKTIK